MPTPPHSSETARRLFPRGLRQPGGSFRFSADALLLASFLSLAPDREQGTIVELGTGCGVVALAMLLRHPLAQAVGIERQASLAAAAMENARALGLGGRMRVLEGDLRLLCRGSAEKKAEGSPLHTARTSLANACDVALANPPYRVRGSGRLPREEARQEAFFGEADALEVFCRAAAFCLRDKGRFGVIFPAGQLPDLCLAIQHAGLRVRRIVPVQAFAGEAARFVLVEAQKGSRGEAELVPPLTLHERQGGTAVFTEAALAFCPWLGAEAGWG